MGDLRILLDRAAPTAPPVDVDAIRRRATRRRRVRRFRLGGVLGAVLMVGAAIALRPSGSGAPRLDVVGDSGDASTQTWTPLEIPGVVDNDSHASVLTPEGVFVWADTFASVVVPVSGYISRRPSPPGPSPSGAAITWTGTEVVAFGGRTKDGQLATGSAYNSRTREWRTFASPLSARTPMASAWTGSELLIFGSALPADSAAQSAAYDPATDSWRPLAETPPELTPLASPEGERIDVGHVDAVSMWTGDRLLVVAAARGRTGATPGSYAFSYDPSADQWSRLPDPGLSDRALWAVWTGNEIVAWDYELRAVTWTPNASSWQRLPDLPFEFGECTPGGATGRAGTLLATYCHQAATFDERSRSWTTATPPGSVVGSVHGDDLGYTIVGPRSFRLEVTESLTRCPGSVHLFERPPRSGETGDGLPQSGDASKKAAEQVASERVVAGEVARVRAIDGRAWTREADGSVRIVAEVIYMVEVEVATAESCGSEPMFREGVPVSVVYRRP